MVLFLIQKLFRESQKFICFHILPVHNSKLYFLQHHIIVLNVLFLRLYLFLFSQLKGHWQISKKWCSQKYCSYDKVCHFSALWDTPWWNYLENLEIDDKFINKATRLIFIKRCVSLKCVEKEKLLRRDNKDISLKICWCSHLCKIAV